MQLKIDIEDNFFFLLKENEDEFSKQMVFHHALMLYRKGKLNLAKASELAGYDELFFIQKLQQEGESIFENELTAQMAFSANYILELMKSR